MMGSYHQVGCAMSSVCQWPPCHHSRGLSIAFNLWKSVICLQMLLNWICIPPVHGYSGLFVAKHAPRETCEAETFDPRCGVDEVVVMLMAEYGRMRKGRCAKMDYGFMGCSGNVMSVLDFMCSGRSECDVRIPHKKLDVYYNCSTDFKTYLNASYACVQVETSSCDLCKSSDGRRNKEAKVSLRNGFIASWVTVTTGVCGTGRCPWVIEAKPGQRINLTLFDFTNRTSPHQNGCSRLGVIKEETTPSLDIPICKGSERQKHMFTSVSNRVEVHVVSPTVLETKGHFLLHYEAIGCPDYDPPDNTVYKRLGDKITITCRHNKKTWDLYCQDSEWKASDIYCPPEKIPPIPPGPISLPLGVLIAIVVGIALVIGVLILTVGIVCLKRQQHDLHQRSETALYVRARQEPEYREDMGDPRFVPKYETTPLTYTQKPPARVALPPPQGTGTAAHGGPRENLYFRRMESRPLPSLPNVEEKPTSTPPPPYQTQGYSDDDVDRYRVQVHRTGSGREQHCHYQPRVVTKRAHSTGSSSRDDPQYFVLDPDDHVPESKEEEEGATSSACAPRPTRKRTPSGPAGQTSSGASAHVQGGSPDAHASSGVASTYHSGSGRIEGNVSNNQPPKLSKPNQKSPEQENVENDSKEVHMNSSCHEIPLRPSREGSQTSKVAETSNTGNSSWP